MRALYFTMSCLLLSISQTLLADAKVEAIDDVSLTSCLTTKIKLNQDALKSYKGSNLTLKVQNEASEETYSAPIKENNGVFSWEKAIPVGENLTFMVLKDDAPISYPYSKNTQAQLTKLVAPTQVAQAEVEEDTFVRGLGAADANKKDMSIAIPKDLLSKEVLVVLVSEDGKSLWQHYGSADSPALTAKVPDATYAKPRVIASDTTCK